MAKKIRWGRKAVVIPLYITAGVLVIADMILPFGDYGRLGILVFLTAAVMHILGKLDQKTAAVQEKIDDSVGPVWEAGERAGERNAELRAATTAQKATVTRLAPRR